MFVRLVAAALLASLSAASVWSEALRRDEPGTMIAGSNIRTHKPAESTTFDLVSPLDQDSNPATTRGGVSSRGGAVTVVVQPNVERRELEEPERSLELLPIPDGDLAKVVPDQLATIMASADPGNPAGSDTEEADVADEDALASDSADEDGIADTAEQDAEDTEDEESAEAAVCPEPVRFARVAGVAANGLRVRSGPGVGYGVRALLRDGAPVRVVGGPKVDAHDVEWYELAGDDAVRGWSSAAYLALVDPCGPEANRDPRGRVFSARLTAYTYQEPVGGAHGSITRSGLPVAWGLVAVDPRVIPLGTWLTIEGFREPFLAADTGFGVIGEHVDIFFPDYESAIQFGVQYREVVVLDAPPRR